MEFGLILPTVNNGNFISEAAPQWIPTWELNKNAIVKAERYGFEFALGQVTLRGFGGKTQMWDHALEPMTLAGGLCAVTEKIKIYGSVPILAVNPAIAARQAATLSSISSGRFGLNIVSGWAEAQYSQMGEWPGDAWYRDRYKGAEEYVTILKELWETGVSDHKGEFFSMEDCRLGPLPPHPVEIVCAGQSDSGMEFTAKHGDYAFINGEGGVEGVRTTTARLLSHAEKTGRDVGAHVTQLMIIRDSDAEAQEAVAAIREGADLAALERITGQAVLDTAGSTSALLSAEIEKLRDMVCFNLNLVAGSPATVAEHLDELASIEGISGVMIIFEDVYNGIDRLAREVAPLMRTPSAVASTVAA